MHNNLKITPKDLEESSGVGVCMRCGRRQRQRDGTCLERCGSSPGVHPYRSGPSAPAPGATASAALTAMRKTESPRTSPRSSSAAAAPRSPSPPTRPRPSPRRSNIRSQGFTGTHQAPTKAPHSGAFAFLRMRRAAAMCSCMMARPSLRLLHSGTCRVAAPLRCGCSHWERRDALPPMVRPVARFVYEGTGFQRT